MSDHTEGLRKAAKRVFWEASQIDKAVKETRREVADEALMMLCILDVCRYASKAPPLSFDDNLLRKAQMHTMELMLHRLMERQLTDDEIRDEFYLTLDLMVGAAGIEPATPRV
jgi:hypothetical protein